MLEGRPDRGGLSAALSAALREQLECLLTETRQTARHAAESQNVEAFWHIGDTLTAHIDAHEGTTYGQQVVRSLSNDLHLGYTTLYEITRFRRTVADPRVYAHTHFG